jgi:Tol biopolymer transport system component
VPLSAGTRLGPYEILTPLGAGGMGEVYRARDSKLDREVAVKVLPEELAAHPDALARFEREAKAVAALNHPNILGIYDFGTVGTVAYAVMELLEGETLRDRLDAGALPPRKAIDYAHQIAVGLAAAHERGIVHRDLKPENLFLTRDGRMKILDFGLAKKMGGASEGESTSAPTMSRQTDPGTVMGTVGYMSPEQVRGLAVDHRSDIFALGAILYEMLSGKRAFRRDTASDTMSAILRDDPPELLESGRNVPPSLDRLVRHCLEKNPGERFQSARDIAFDLEAASGTSTSGAVRASERRSRTIRTSPSLLVAVAVAALAAGALLDRVLRREPAPSLVAVRPLTHSGKDLYPAVSPDGKTMAFASMRDGTTRIWLKQLATGDEVSLTAGPDYGPRFSPDGSQVLFLHGGNPIGPPVFTSPPELYRVSLIGGSPRRIVARAGDADWSPDGRLVAFARANDPPPGSALLTVSPDGGEPREIARWPNRVVFQPRFSSDGKQIAVSSVSSLSNSGSSIEILSVDGSHRRSLAIPGSLGFISSTLWSPSGARLLFAQSLQVRFGASRLLEMNTRSGKTTPLVWLPSEIGAIDDIGPGRLVADSATSRQNLAEIDLGNPSAPLRWITRGTSTDRQPVFSPDGEWVAFSSNRSGNLDIWELSTKTGALRRLTDAEADDWDPGFTHDGKLIWSSGRTGHLEIWSADPDGGSPRQVTHEAADAENPTDTPDGWITYALTNSSKQGLWKIRPDGTGAARTGPCLNVPDASPDGRYVACADLPAGPLRVVRLSDGALLPFHIDIPHSRYVEASLGRSRWSVDGKRLYFLGQDENGVDGIFVQDFDPLARDTTATRRKVAGFDPNSDAESFAISPDGTKLVVAFLERSYGIVTIEGVPGAGKAPRSH